MKGLYGFIHDSRLKYPDKAFVQSMDREWTFGEVDYISRSISECLLDYGVKKGDRIVIFCDNSIQYIAAFFGTLRINAVAVPVNPNKMIESFIYIVGKCSPKLILTSSSTDAKLDGIRSSLNADIVNIDERNLLHIPGHPISFGEEQDFMVDEDDVAEILFTSGTTADPKGVTLTHRNLMANTAAIMDYLKLTGKDSILMTLPFTYSYGNSVLLTHAFAGASIIIGNNAAFPYKVLNDIKKYGVTGFSTVGSYIGLLLKYIKNSDAGDGFFDSLRYITLAGEATCNDDIEFIINNYPGIELFVMYGQTEASARLSYLDPGLLRRKLGSVGKGLSNVELRVVDETGALVKPGEIGEIIARGPSIMKGYWDDPEATGKVLRQGWLYTGDNATVDEDGFIYIKGRKTDLIKHMGHRISPVEIENIINSHSYVKESAVTGDMLDGVKVIKAFIVLRKEHPVNEIMNDLDEIKKYAWAKLPVYMRPHVFEVIEQLPRTDSGKIKRSALRRVQCVG